jgi:protein-L-isoaspartate O-methyltransferase
MHRFLALVGCLLAGLAAFARDPVPPPSPLYTEAPGSPDGLGKWFLGREIAHFMTHHGASWLERPERVDEESPATALELLALRPGDVVADVGAGSGYFSWRMGRLVGPKGRVYATDIQPEMLAILRTNVLAHGVTNVIPVLGTTSDPKLPANALDLILLVDVYHE